MFFKYLMQTAYLPVEVPPAISARNFAEYCCYSYGSLKCEYVNLSKSNTQYETYSAPRTKNGRRVLSLVNPVAQIAMSLAITDHRAEIRKLLGNSLGSHYSTNTDSVTYRAFKGLEFRRFEQSCLAIMSAYPFILRADISRFFYTAYSHSIPWSVLGKEKAKYLYFNNKSQFNKQWSNKLDHCIQAAQSRETFGLPVGPDTSRVLAEMLMTRVEMDLGFSKAAMEGRYARLIDDFFVGCSSEEEARSILNDLRRTLWQYNLQLNEEKTSISASSRVSLHPLWRASIELIRISSANAERQRQDIHRLLEVTVSLCQQYHNDAPASWACVKLRQVTCSPDNIVFYLETLFRLARDFPVCVRLVCEYLFNHRNFLTQEGMYPLVEKWILSIAARHYRQGEELELSWALMICCAYKIKVGENILSDFERMPRSVPFLLFGVLRKRNLLEFSLSKWNFKSVLKKSGIYGEHWLALYEFVVQGWTKDKQLISLVKNDKVFSSMLARKVTFLNTEVLDARRLNLAKRTFSPSPKESKRPRSLMPEQKSENEKSATPWRFEFLHANIEINMEDYGMQD